MVSDREGVDMIHYDEPEKFLYNRRGRACIEKDVEKYGNICCIKEGWVPEKFLSVNKTGVPDRVITATKEDGSAFIFYIEYKAPKKKPTKIQRIDHRTRRKMGAFVFVADNNNEVDIIIKIVKYLLETTEVVDPFSIPKFLLD
jgi:hypothetical protein